MIPHKRKNSNRIKVIIFDWGNVIEHYDNKKFVKKMSAYFDVDPVLFKKVELKNRLQHDLGKLTTQEFVRNVSRSIKKKISVTQYYNLLRVFRIRRLNREMISVIRKLKKRYKIFLLSNNSKPIRDVLLGYKLESLFDKILFSFEVKTKKPRLKFFKLLLRKTPFSFVDCIFVDDRKDTCGVAESLGMKAILFKDNRDFKKRIRALSLFL